MSERLAVTAKRIVCFAFGAAAVLLCAWLCIFVAFGSDFKAKVTEAASSSADGMVSVCGESFPISDLPSLRFDSRKTAYGQNLSDPQFANQGYGASESAASFLLDAASGISTRNMPLYEDDERWLSGWAEPTIIYYHGIKISFSRAVHSFPNSYYESTLDKMPSFLLDLLGERGWEICVIDKEIEDYFPIVAMITDVPGNVAGLCDVRSKRIWVNDDTVPSVLVHEVGHAVDWEMGGESLSSEWKEALSAITEASTYSKEIASIYEPTLFGSTIKTPVCDNILSRDRFFEQYATAFASYWNNPIALLEECPDAFLYFAERFGIYGTSGYDTSEGEISFEQELERAYLEGERQRENPVELSMDKVHDVWLDDDAHGGKHRTYRIEEAIAGVCDYVTYLASLQS